MLGLGLAIGKRMFGVSRCMECERVQQDTDDGLALVGVLPRTLVSGCKRSPLESCITSRDYPGGSECLTSIELNTRR